MSTNVSLQQALTTDGEDEAEQPNRFKSRQYTPWVAICLVSFALFCFALSVERIVQCVYHEVVVNFGVIGRILYMFAISLGALYNGLVKSTDI